MIILKKRISVLFFSFIFILSSLFAKIFYLSVFKNEEYKKAVLNQETVCMTVKNERGTIYDRNLIPLTERDLSLFHITDSGKVKTGSGKSTFIMPSRYAPSGVATHITGYTDIDGVGVCGVEKKFDSLLKSDEKIKVTYLSDAVGGPMPDSESELTKENGTVNSLSLTIDYHIQKVCEDVLDKYVPKGSAVVLDVNTFDVLAIASNPKFDANNLSKSMSSENGELLNRALCQYNAGSIFKIVTASALIDENPYLNREYLCNGFKEINSHTFYCNKKDGHGLQSLSKAFANSCNCAFYEIGLAVGGEKITKTAIKLGLGERKLFFGSEEAKGNIPVKENYTQTESANISIGQGEILITPIQCALMCATIANGGIRGRVNIAKSVIDENGEAIESLTNYDSVRAIKEETAKKISSMMRDCVLYGTAKKIASSPLEIAGKTGSAETGWQKEDLSYYEHGWFCGFFPYSSPKYAVAVFSEDGKSGAVSAVEPFLKICEGIDKFYPIKE